MCPSPAFLDLEMGTPSQAGDHCVPRILLPFFFPSPGSQLPRPQGAVQAGPGAETIASAPQSRLLVQEYGSLPSKESFFFFWFLSCHPLLFLR